jgi:ADP-ribose pyrophosphatase
MSTTPLKILSCERRVEYERSCFCDNCGKVAYPLVKPPARFINLWDIKYELEGGKQGVYNFVTRKQQPLPVTGIIKPDAVVILPIVNCGNSFKVAVTCEFRLPLGTYEYGLPAGLIDGDETPESAAARELKEEIGLTVTDVLRVSPPMPVSPGLTDEIISIVIVRAEGVLSTYGQESIEHISVQLMDHDELNRLFNREGKYQNVLISAKLWPLLTNILLDF